jgi:hypothetical protein
MSKMKSDGTVGANTKLRMAIETNPNFQMQDDLLEGRRINKRSF